jgi:hypothetical protein
MTQPAEQLVSLPVTSPRLDGFAYSALVRRVQALVREVIPPGSSVLVLSKGDEDLVNFDGRRGLHFPQAAGGAYSGFHPADSTEAITHLEELRLRGAGYLVVPETSFWWLGYYGALRDHLLTHYGVVRLEEPTCVIFDIEGSLTVGTDVSPRIASDRGDDQLRDVVRALLPPNAVIAIANPGRYEVVELDQQTTISLTLTDKRVRAKAKRSDADMRELERAQDAGAEFLVIPRSAFGWFEDRADFAEHVRKRHRLVTRQEHVCELYELSGPAHSSSVGDEAERDD